MFGLFNKIKKDLLVNWHIPIDASFTRIDNRDSVQFVHEDGSRVLYFSILNVTGKTSILGGTFKKQVPLLSTTKNGWQLKGIRDARDEILVCVFSFTDENDQQWAEDLLASIVHVGGM